MGNPFFCTLISPAPPLSGTYLGQVCHSAGLHPARQRRGGLQVASGVPPDATSFVPRRQAPISSSVGTSIDSHGWNPWASPRAQQFTERRRMAVWIHANACILIALVRANHCQPIHGNTVGRLVWACVTIPGTPPYGGVDSCQRPLTNHRRYHQSLHANTRAAGRGELSKL